MSTITSSALVSYANDLVCDQGDTTMLGGYAANLLAEELPQIPNGWLGELTITSATAGTAQVSVTSTVRKLLAVFYAGRELSHESQATLDAQGGTWPDAAGAPRAWTTDREQDRTVCLYPVPTLTTTSTASLVTESDAVIFFAVTAQTTLPLYLRLPAALWLLSHEYSRESKYRDLDFAKLCQSIAERMFNLVDGVVVDPNVKP